MVRLLFLRVGTKVMRPNNLYICVCALSVMLTKSQYISLSTKLISYLSQPRLGSQHSLGFFNKKESEILPE